MCPLDISRRADSLAASHLPVEKALAEREAVVDRRVPAPLAVKKARSDSEDENLNPLRPVEASQNV